MQIAQHDLTKHVLIVAEIGNNHEGDFERAKEMIARAAEAGVDAVKFQTIVPEKLVSSREAPRLAQLRRFKFTYAQFAALAEVAERQNVLFLSTPFDADSVAFLDELVCAFKIASGDNDCFPLLEIIARTGKPVILSTGLLDDEGIRRAKNTIERTWSLRNIKSDLALLHCVSAYPVPAEDANLAAIKTLAQFGCVVGYSDHTVGNRAAILSVALGARIIEKHFTLDHNLSDFRDHKLSADPREMADLVQEVRNAEVMLGSGAKQAMPSESANAASLRRAIMAAHPLSPGLILRAEHLTWLRPRIGFEPGRENELVGREVKVPIAEGDPILPEHLV
jgi:sialic acid synthase SpsE